jgi:hypothetical protein
MTAHLLKIKLQLGVDLTHSQWRFHERFHNINYLVTSDLMMTYHCIYKERDKTSFIEIKII